eukprot:5134852-Pyramimonas_sp.AAC.1
MRVDLDRGRAAVDEVFGAFAHGPGALRAREYLEHCPLVEKGGVAPVPLGGSSRPPRALQCERAVAWAEAASIMNLGAWLHRQWAERRGTIMG